MSLHLPGNYRVSYLRLSFGSCLATLLLFTKTSLSLYCIYTGSFYCYYYQDPNTGTRCLWNLWTFGSFLESTQVLHMMGFTLNILTSSKQIFNNQQLVFNFCLICKKCCTRIAAGEMHHLHKSHTCYWKGGQGEAVSCPPSALIFCEGWKMLLQESNQSLGSARLQLLSAPQLTLFDISEAWPKSASGNEEKKRGGEHLSKLSGTVLTWEYFPCF